MCAAARDRPPVVRSVRTPEALAALRAWLESRPEEMRAAGVEYFARGAVQRVWAEADHYFKGEVRGEKPYTVLLFWTRGAWSSKCTCPTGRDCKHACAATLAWLADVAAGTMDGADPLAAGLSVELPDHTPLSPLLPRQSKNAFRDEWAPVIAKKLGRALTDDEEDQLVRLAALFADIALSPLKIYPAQLHRHGFEYVPPPGTTPYQPAFAGWWDHAGAPAEPWALWQFIAYDYERHGRAVPEILRPLTDTTAVHTALDHRLAQQELTVWRLALDPPEEFAKPAREHGRVLVAPTTPIEAVPLQLAAAISPTARDRLDIHLVTAEGRDASDAHLISLRPEPLYEFAGRVWRGPPPLPAMPLPMVALADEELIARLRDFGLRLPASLGVKVRRVTMRPVLKCWIAQPRADRDQLFFHAQLLARADDPSCTQHLTGSGWRWTKGGTPPPRATSEPALLFDFSETASANDHLAAFNLRWDGWAGVWTRSAPKNFPEEFIDWHAQRPSELTIEFSSELAALLGPALVAQVEFSAAPAAGAGRDWFDLTVAFRIADTLLTDEEIALLLKARGKWVRLAGHGWRRLEVAPAVGDPTLAALERLGLQPGDVIDSGRPMKHRLHALQLAGEAASFAARDAALATELRERARALAALPPPPLPPGLLATLRHYQEEGFHFLAHLSANNFGGILADDMGLGKTVQALTWLLHQAEAVRTNPARAGVPFRVLVICPKSVMHGWLTETERFAPSLHAVTFTPEHAERETTPGPAGEPAILVANYTQLRLNAAWFKAQAWDAVILDEGQFIKNPTSQTAVVARSIPAVHRLALTGTPIENRLLDLWSLFAFVQPGLLGTQSAFRRQFPEEDPAATARLRRRVRHFMLRRTKAQVAPELPSRTEDEIVVDLEGGARRLYDAELKRARAQLLGIETDRALDAVRFNVLASLLRLRQICCHPALVSDAHRDLPSAKLDALLERLEELRDEGQQVLVFSQFVQLLELIRVRLVTADITHLMLTGQTQNRAELVDKFQADRSQTVFLLSLKAAGFGLNLTAASYVILCDPWWNPAVEAQAIDRTHRIGQTQPVVAYRLIAADTVEQKIRALQREKAALAAAVVQEENLASILDLQSLRQILG